MTPWAGAELSHGPSPEDRPSTGTPRQPGDAGGGGGTEDSASDRSSQQKSKTTFPKHTQPTGPLSVSTQSRCSRCVKHSAAVTPGGPLTVR